MLHDSRTNRHLACVVLKQSAPRLGSGRAISWSPGPGKQTAASAASVFQTADQHFCFTFGTTPFTAEWQKLDFI